MKAMKKWWPLLLAVAFIVVYLSVGAMTKTEHKRPVAPADVICYVYPDGHVDCLTET